jgi:hypothetical protein
MADQNNSTKMTELIVSLQKVSAFSDPDTAKDLLGNALILAEALERSQSLPAMLQAELAKLN